MACYIRNSSASIVSAHPCHVSSFPGLLSKWELSRQFFQGSERCVRKLHAVALFPGLGICSFAHRSFAHLLILLKSNEQLWALRSDRSRQMSDHEQISQVAQRKWVTVSDSLRLLRGNEQSERIAHFAHQKWANERFAQKNLAKQI